MDVSEADWRWTVTVSPGLMPRPSLSERYTRASQQWRKGVAGVDAPAFVERSSTTDSSSSGAFDVSPGLMPRPSLSAIAVSPGLMRRRASAVRVAGVDAPAFVERTVVSVDGPCSIAPEVECRRG